MARGILGLWADVPTPTRLELQRIYRDLSATYGPFMRLTRRWAKAAAETWLVAGAVSEEAAILAAQRRRGKGRKPKRSQVSTAAKRQALELGTLDGVALKRLELAKRNGHYRPPGADLAERVLRMAPLTAPEAGTDEARMSGPPRLTRGQILERLTGEQGQRLVILPWWREAFAALDAPGVRELLLWLPRQAGKSQALAAMAITELLTVPDAFVVFLSAGADQAESIYARKIRRPLERLVRALGLPRDFITLTKRGVEIPSLGSALAVLATNESTAPGRSPSLLLLDEARDIRDEVYTALAPSVIGVGGTLVVASTAGAPRGFFYQLVSNPTPETWLYHATENENPHASLGVVEFLRRRLGLLSPASVAREIENQFAEDGQEFLPAALIEAAVDDGLGELATSGSPAWAFLDLSRTHDLTSLAVVVRTGARRPEALDHLTLASLRVWNPAQSPTKETDFAEVRAALAELPRRFPALRQVLVDEGAEAGSVLPWAKAHAALTTTVEGFRATPESNMALWSALAARLHGRTLSIPRHERLLAELRGLRQEAFSFGSKWRIVDASKKFHRDVSLALAGAVHAADREPVPTGPLVWGGPQRVDARGVEVIQGEEDARAEAAHAAAAVSMAETLKRHCVYWPDDLGGRFGRRE